MLLKARVCNFSVGLNVELALLFQDIINLVYMKHKVYICYFFFLMLHKISSQNTNILTLT